MGTGNNGSQDAKSKLVVKTISIRATGSIGMPFAEYLKWQDEMWICSTKLAAGVVWEMAVRDAPPWRTGSTKMKETKEVFGMPAASLAYRLVSGKIPTGLSRYADKLPSGVVSFMTQRFASDYSHRRRGVMLHFNDRFPIYRFPYPLGITGSAVSIGIDPENEANYTVTFPLLRTGPRDIKEVTLVLKRARGDRNTESINGEPPLLEKIRLKQLELQKNPSASLEYSLGSITISGEPRRVSSRESEGLPVHKDKNKNRFVFDPVIGLSVYFPVKEQSRRAGFLLLHTDPAKFLVARFSNGDEAWNLTQEHIHRRWTLLSPAQMREAVKRQGALIQALREDRKTGDSGVRAKMTSASEKHARLLNDFLHRMTRLAADKFDKINKAEVRFACGDDCLAADSPGRYMPHFPWFMFAETLAYKLKAMGIVFTKLDKFEYRPNAAGGFDFKKLFEQMKLDDASAKRRSTNLDNEHHKRDKFETCQT